MAAKLLCKRNSGERGKLYLISTRSKLEWLFKSIRYIQQILLFYFCLAFNYAKIDRPDMTSKLQITFGGMKTRVKNNPIRTRFQRKFSMQ